MAPTMTLSGYFLLVLSCCLFSGRRTGFKAPIVISLLAATACIQPSSAQVPLVTQTVYGFLDFTTTIGNTVMVFSPQSAAPDVEKTTEAIVNVIETKPFNAVTAQPSLTIKPSKTQIKSENKASGQTTQKISSEVNIQSNAPVIASKIEIITEPSSKINVINGASSVIKSNPDVQSKIEGVAVPASRVSEKNIITKVEVISGTSKVEASPVISSRVEVYEGPSSSIVTPSPIVSSIVDIHTAEDAIVIGNNVAEPEYDFLSRQPSEVVEETYKVINLKPSSKFHLKPRPTAEIKNKQGPATRADPLHPTGLVTKLGGTIVKDGITTVHETKVIGTYIAGKYAQVLQSTSHIQQSPPKAKIKPSSTLRILKTAAPTPGKPNKHHLLEPTPVRAISIETATPVESSTKSTRKTNSLKRPKNRPREQDVPEEINTTPSTAKKNGNKLRTTPAPRTTTKPHTTSQRPHKRNKKNGGKTARTISVHSEPPPTTTQASSRKFQPRKNSKPNVNTPPSENNLGSARRGYKPRGQVHPSSVEPIVASTSVYKFKLNRAPGRWQYKTTPKPRVTIRKQNDDEPMNTTSSYSDVNGINDYVTPQSKMDDVERLVGSESIASIIDDENSTENKIDNPYPLETLKVEISTPPDFKDTYYEIATIKSPYTFQIGSVKNTRYVTLTSTIQKVLESSTVDNGIHPTNSEPLTENILATANNYDKDNNFLDSSISTLPPLYMAADMETPPLETMTETFSTTQTMLKTHILPAVRGGNVTSSYTLVQTYLVTRFVTATKTLPPMEAYHFVPSKTLNEFNSYLDEAGSELNLELAFGDENDNEADSQPRRAFLADLDLANIGSDFDLSDVDKSNLSAHIHLRSKKAHAPLSPKPPINDHLNVPGLSPEQLQQLALLRLLNPGSGQGQVITTSKPVIKIETVYESHVVPILNGHNTILTTISKSLGTVTKTDYEFGTSTLPPALPPLPNLPIPPINGLFQQQQPQFAVTTSPVLQTTLVTETNSKVLKLTFGAKTAYTTILSTTLVPTVLTTYMTGSVPVQPTAAFPGYFPAPYPAFPYLG
ncbi:hypothetical protein RN001_003225 [Aquatica leii]|uniref:DUF4758 domain-containing protein n=1 Tax=Aquatica leii TaxID=1421715 RepID=A0AAN7Q623_9COLE|nr:hypothetical protein RN001_003225 [Aquatica leii]